MLVETRKGLFKGSSHNSSYTDYKGSVGETAVFWICRITARDAPFNTVESMAEHGHIVFWSVVELLCMQQLLQITLSVYSFCLVTVLK